MAHEYPVPAHSFMILPSRNSEQRILIIGGGVAGATCALQLARHGLHVDLAEKAQFPRNKACGCCIGGAGLAILQTIGLREQVMSSGLQTSRWIASMDAKQVELTLPIGVAVSREKLDPLILDAAVSAGATLKTHCEATVRAAHAGAPVVVCLKDANGTCETKYDVVVVAAGLSAAGLGELLPWEETPNGPFGFSCMMQIDGVEPAAIYMACTDDGYVGLVKLADGQVDVAAALAPGAAAARAGTPFERVRQIVAESAFPFEVPDLFHAGEGTNSDVNRPIPETYTTPPLRRSRRAGNGRIIAIGDAAGYVEPFTGEGMTWAMQSAVAAAELIAKSETPEEIGDQWQIALPRLLGKKKWVCRAVTRGLRSAWLRASAAKVLSAVPGVASPIVKSLSRP